MYLSSSKRQCYNRLQKEERVKRTIALIAIATITSAMLQASAALIMDVTPYALSNGFSVDGGTLTLLDSAPNNGLLENGEIMEWEINVTFGDSSSFTFTSLNPVHSYYVNAPQTLTATELILSDSFGIDFKDNEATFETRSVDFRDTYYVANFNLATPSGWLHGQLGKTIAAIPEPASIGLLGLVSCGIFFTRRIFMV
jgi:hypothetical protein